MPKYERIIVYIPITYSYSNIYILKRHAYLLCEPHEASFANLVRPHEVDEVLMRTS